ncbi:MAG TPA: hypothetical protein VFG96_00305 [Jiangellaceae bacterium]|nr:hypothetical protein [Jiangellaceae bacterium]
MRRRASAKGNRSPTLDDVADVAAYVASDRPGGMTGTVMNISCGSVVD